MEQNVSENIISNELTNRLKLIADKVLSNTKYIADIGTDHAYIPIYLVKNNICDKAIASDINYGPIEMAKNNIKNQNCEEKIEVRHGGGLATLKQGEVDSFIIAGMGGILIKDIIDKDIDITRNVGYFILQPMQYVNILRKYLVQNNFYIYDEDLVEDMGKIYQIICACDQDKLQKIKPYIKSEPAKIDVELTERLSEKLDYIIGAKTIEKKPELLKKLLFKYINQYQIIYKNILENGNELSKENLDYYKTLIDNLEEVVEYVS
jgi:tRNA (adenine22-N1)-methyltransferase